LLVTCGKPAPHVIRRLVILILISFRDAGITLSCELNELVDSKTDDPLSKVLQVPEGKERLQVLELGTGCGMVGITIAQGASKADIILTDLPEAEEIVQRNIDQATLVKDSTLRFQTLDWDDHVPKDLNNWAECPHCTELDLIIAADCTYNPDSRWAPSSSYYSRWHI
jgi:hypothetical protein